MKFWIRYLRSRCCFSSTLCSFAQKKREASAEIFLLAGCSPPFPRNYEDRSLMKKRRIYEATVLLSSATHSARDNSWNTGAKVLLMTGLPDPRGMIERF